MNFRRDVWRYLTGYPERAGHTDEYHMTPIPKPPFIDQADRDASLGAALVHVTHTVTGEWPMPEAVKAAVELLTTTTRSKP
jgi:hypothetical protein